MAPPLPLSLSPHICILPSPDLTRLLQSSSLPPLPSILQSFSPLPQVTTRSTSLVSIPHASFALRFSDLIEIEDACREEEEQRAVRTMDWMAARISKRCRKWVEDAERGGDEAVRTPWWDELRRCAEGDHIPSKTEGWNHPVAVILAVSTTAPNPLQAISALHSRAIQLPAWVDPNILRYTLIIHPKNSPLSDEEAGALFNAVKKQFGLHAYLLPLNLPSPPPPPVPVPALMPRLPPPPAPDSSNANNTDSVPDTPNQPGSPMSAPNVLNTLRMEQNDIQQTARFTREFLVMSLIPWMEKCVLEWNESFSSTRRLPSRLFSSTRRLFGSPSPSPAPTHNPSSSVSSLPGRPTQYTSGNTGGLTPPSPQRRLAEFATILGDIKLAITVWEALRKESKGGSDMIPLLSAPSPAMQLHASNALSNIHPTSKDLPPHAQILALLYAVRWEAGISSAEFLSSALEGDRWLVWAAGNAEEAPSALLLAQAALLSTKRGARRRAALLYVSAANRLEKCGIKLLTMYFLRKAQDLYNVQPTKSLSPSFWEAEGISPMDVKGFDAIMSGIEHPLGRLLYTTGDVAAAVRFFLGLLRGSSGPSVQTVAAGNGAADAEMSTQGNDQVFLDDFRVAFAHLKSIEPEKSNPADFQLPFKLCVEHQTKLRFLSDTTSGQSEIWGKREEDWKSFWKSKGWKEDIAKSGRTSTDELFWVDLVLRNPLDTEVNLSNLTLAVEEAKRRDPSSSGSPFEVEVIDNVVLGARESRTIPISLRSRSPGSLVVTHAKYEFLSLLPSTESLASRGHRLHDTLAQRLKPTYAPDILMTVEVVHASHKLLANFVQDGQLVLVQGENKTMTLCLSNVGTKPIKEIWMVAGPDDEIWVGKEAEEFNTSSESEKLQSCNSLRPQQPIHIPISTSNGSSTLAPGEGTEIPVTLRTEHVGFQELSLLFVFRENQSEQFRSVRLSRTYEVQPLLHASATAEPSQSLDHMYFLDIVLTNLSSTSVDVTQVMTISPLWRCTSAKEDDDRYSVPPSQCSHVLLGADRWTEGSGSKETVDFVSGKLSDVLHGRSITASDPPPIDLLCSHVTGTSRSKSIYSPKLQYFIHAGRRNYTSQSVARIHPYIPASSHADIFPLYNPASVDAVVFWEIPSQRRSGHLNVLGISLGAGHAALQDIIDEAASAKVKRSMYAETRRENMEVLDAIRGSEWNTEMNPVSVTLQQADTVTHDFSKGPCQVPVTFILRNYSLTQTTRFTLHLNTNSTVYPLSSNLLPPPYSGRLTFRGSIPPSEASTLRPKLWITRPGAYGLGGWTLETQIGEVPTSPPVASGVANRVRRYLQEPLPTDRTCLMVCDSRIS